VGGARPPEGQPKSGSRLHRLLARDIGRRYGDGPHANDRPDAGGAAARRRGIAAGLGRYAFGNARRGADGDHVGRVGELRRGSAVGDRAAMVQEPQHRRRPAAPGRAGDQMGDPGGERAHALRARRARRRIRAARPDGTGLPQRPARSDAAGMDAARQPAPGAAAAQDPGVRYRCRKGRRTAGRRPQPGHPDRGRRPRSERFHGTSRTRRALRYPCWQARRFCEFSQKPSIASRLGRPAVPKGCRSRAAGRLPGSLVRWSIRACKPTIT